MLYSSGNNILVRSWNAIDSLRLPWPLVFLIIFILVTAIFAPFLTPHTPLEIDLPNRLAPPAWIEGGSPEHLLGTDTVGRDLLTRILYGGRISLTVAAITLLIGGTIGLVLGLIAGYSNEVVDGIIMRMADAFLSLPFILLAIVFAMTLGPSLTTTVLAICLALWARIARVVRGEVLSVKRRDYVLQAKVAGCSSARILFVHILPNVFHTFMVMLSLEVVWIIHLEATLSFLGAGIPPPTPSWGGMVAEGRGYITSAWWIIIFPSLMLALFVLSFNLFGDWLRDRLDPRLRQL